jgi:hypothetical protein
MSFRNKIDFFVPAAEGQDQKVSSKPLAAVGGVYIVNKNRVLRIVVGSTDRYVQFAKVKTDLANTVDNTNGYLLAAGEIIYLSTSDFDFMKSSGDLASVSLTTDKG